MPSPSHSLPFTRREPLAPVMTLGDRYTRTGAILALVVALGSHGYASGRALASLYPMRQAATHIRDGVHDFFWTMYDVELPPEPAKADEPPPPEPEPEPIAAPAPQAPSPTDNTPPPADDVYKEAPPPTPAQAAAVMTAPPDDEPMDFTDKGFVTGDGTGPGYGVVSQAGTGNTPVTNTAAKLTGKPGGTGTGSAPAAPAPTGPDLSKAPTYAGGSGWNCAFPDEADVDGIDNAVASIVVTVRPDGSPLSVKVVSDPGHGFGRAARMCALSKRFVPGTDRSGQAITGTTPPIRVRFTR